MKKTNIIDFAPIVKLKDVRKFIPRNKKIVLVGGGFDLIHPGHIDHLFRARSQGDFLAVHITGDKRYLEKRNRKPIFSELDRAKIVSAIRFVDCVFVHNGKHFDQDVVDIVQPDVLYFNKESYDIIAKDFVENVLRFSGKIFVSRTRKTHSSSEIKEIIRSEKNK